MRRKFLILLALLLAISASASAEEIAVRVGKQTFTVEQVQAYVEQAAKTIETSLGMSLSEIYDDESKMEFLTEAAEHFVTVGVMEAKLAELGLDRISAEEERELRKYAQDAYAQIWQETSARVREAYPDLEDAEELVAEKMESGGYSMDEIYMQSLRSLRQQRLIDVYCKDIAVADGEAEAYYEENFVKPDREKYESDVPLFEQEVLFAGGSSAYVPEGYFYIKYIVLEPDAAASDAVFAAEEALAESEAEYEKVRAKLADAAAEGEVPDALRQEHERLKDEREKAQAALEAGMRAAEEKYAPIAELIQKEINDGRAFEELILKHSTLQEMTSKGEPGFPFHPDSQIWDERLAEAVKKLEKYGDCTPPVYALDSVYIVCRMDDMRCGAYAPSAETMETLRENLLYEKQSEALNAMIQEWRQDMEIEVDISGLEFCGD